MQCSPNREGILDSFKTPERERLQVLLCAIQATEFDVRSCFGCRGVSFCSPRRNRVTYCELASKFFPLSSVVYRKRALQ
jgi:hypothetical protein